MSERARLLVIEDVTVRYGGLTAVDAVSMHVEAGRVTGLIGPNGAGKTSLVDALTGFAPVSGGRVRLDGNDITRMSAHQRARRDLGRTFQSIELFDDLTVRENLLVGASRARWWSLFRDTLGPTRELASRNIAWTLDLLGLADVADRLPTQLSQGRRKLVGVGRALAANPRLVLLDEPAAGLDSDESEVFGSHLRALTEHGITVLLVDHDMRLVLSRCDTIWVLEFGRVIASGTPEAIRADPRVIAAYLGDRSASTTSVGGANE